MSAAVRNQWRPKIAPPNLRIFARFLRPLDTAGLVSRRLARACSLYVLLHCASRLAASLIDVSTKEVDDHCHCQNRERVHGCC